MSEGYSVGPSSIGLAVKRQRDLFNPRSGWQAIATCLTRAAAGRLDTHPAQKRLPKSGHFSSARARGFRASIG